VTREEFYRLYINSTLLSQAALRRVAAEILRAPTITRSETTGDESIDLDTQLAQQFANLDLNALDSIESEMDLNAAQDADTFESLPASDAGPDDLDPAVRLRLDHVFETVDLASVSAELTSIAQGPEPLTAVLSPEALSTWIDRYCNHDPDLSRLVTTVRALTARIA